jgi:hypothetical protein
MSPEDYEKRFTAMEEKMNIMTEFINGLKLSVESEKKKPAEKGIFESIFD